MMIQTGYLGVKSPSGFFSQNKMVKVFRYFKYELLKVIIFLLLFAASVFYVNAESNEYYNKNTESVSGK